jgi:hypothetical protein
VEKRYIITVVALTIGLILASTSAAYVHTNAKNTAGKNSTSILSTAGNKTGGTANHTSGVHRNANIEINY